MRSCTGALCWCFMLCVNKTLPLDAVANLVCTYASWTSLSIRDQDVTPLRVAYPFGWYLLFFRKVLFRAHLLRGAFPSVENYSPQSFRSLTILVMWKKFAGSQRTLWRQNMQSLHTFNAKHISWHFSQANLLPNVLRITLNHELEDLYGKSYRKPLWAFLLKAANGH